MQLYTPIVLAKAGEFNALSELTHLDKIKTIPLVQILPDTATKERKKNYVDLRIKPLLNSWGFLDNRIYLDFHYLGSNVTSLHHEFYDKLKAGGVNIIPVVSVSDSQEAFQFASNRSMLGICLRVTSDKMDVATINRRLDDIVKSAGLDYGDIDLLLDFGHISESHQHSYTNSVSHIIPQIVNKEKIRKIIVASGSYPASTQAFSKHNVYNISRVEWAIWRKLKENFSDQTNLIYSDYGSVSAVYDPYAEAYQGSCSIKYATENEFVLFRGERASDSPIGSKQYQIKSKDLVSKPYYDGPDFSWGDGFIRDCANATVSFGNPASWVKVSQNHHFVKMLRLLSQ